MIVTTLEYLLGIKTPGRFIVIIEPMLAKL